MRKFYASLILACSMVVCGWSQSAVFHHAQPGINGQFTNHFDYSPSRAMAFDSQNRPYFVENNTIITLRNGLWVSYNFEDDFRAKFDSFNETLGDEALVIDGRNNLFMSIKVRIGGGVRYALVFGKNIASSSFNGTFAIHEGLGGWGHIEQRNSHNDFSLHPPVFFGFQWQGGFPFVTPHPWAAKGFYRYKLTNISYTSSGDIKVGKITEIADSCAWMTRHSGGTSVMITKGNYTYVAFTRHDTLASLDSDGNNAAYICRMDRRTNTVSEKVKLFDQGPSFADGHSIPTIGMDDDGYIHVLGGDHASAGLIYSRSSSPENINTMSIRDTIGTSFTYSEQLIDNSDNIYTLLRGGASDGYALFLKKGTTSVGPPGDGNGTLFVNQNCNNSYRVYRHRLAKDRGSKIYASWQSQCGKDASGTDGKRVLAYSSDQGTTWRPADRYSFLSSISGKSVQRITYNHTHQLIESATSSRNFTMHAHSSANLPISYEVISGPATINGNVLTPTGNTGKIIVRAYNNGNTTYFGDELLIDLYYQRTHNFEYGGYPFVDIAPGNYDTQDDCDEVAVIRANGAGSNASRTNRVLIFKGTKLIYNFCNWRLPSFHKIVSGNIDGVAGDEIAVISENSNGLRNRVIIFNKRGNILHDWTYGTVALDDIAIGDFDGDGTTEIAVLRLQSESPWKRNKIYILSKTGGYITEWKLQDRNYTNLTAGNFNSSTADELALTTGNRVVITTRLGGTITHDWTYGGTNFEDIAAGDIDNDGIDEIAASRANGGSPWNHTVSRIITFEPGGSVIDNRVYSDVDCNGLSIGNVDGMNGEDLVYFGQGSGASWLLNKFTLTRSFWRTSPVARSASLIKQSSEDVKLFPVPVTDVLNVSLGMKEGSNIEIINVASGRVVLSLQVLDKETKQFDLSALTPGTYVFKGISMNGNMVNKMFLKK